MWARRWTYSVNKASLESLSTSEVGPGSSHEAVPSTEAPNTAQQEPAAAETSQAVEDQAQQQVAELEEPSAAVQSQASTREHAEDEGVSPVSTVLQVTADKAEPSMATSTSELQGSDRAKERSESVLPLQEGTDSVEAEVKLESVNEVQEKSSSLTESSQSPADAVSAQKEGSKSRESVQLSTVEIQPVNEAGPERRVAAEDLEDTHGTPTAPVSAVGKKGGERSQQASRASEQTGEESRIAVSGINEGHDSADSSSPFDESPVTGVAPQNTTDSALRYAYVLCPISQFEPACGVSGLNGIVEDMIGITKAHQEVKAFQDSAVIRYFLGF